MSAPRKVGCYSDSKVFVVFYSRHGDTLFGVEAGTPGKGLFDAFWRIPDLTVLRCMHAVFYIEY